MLCNVVSYVRVTRLANRQRLSCHFVCIQPALLFFTFSCASLSGPSVIHHPSVPAWAAKLSLDKPPWNQVILRLVSGLVVLFSPWSLIRPDFVSDQWIIAIHACFAFQRMIPLTSCASPPSLLLSTPSPDHGPIMLSFRLHEMYKHDNMHYFPLRPPLPSACRAKCGRSWYRQSVLVTHCF